jgi:site-specific recombinase XerD
MPRITKRLIDTLEPDPKRELSIMDTEVRGFGVRVKPTGAASYFVRYKMPDGSERRMVLGKVGVVTPDEARKLAREKLAAVAAGGDPSAERHETRAALSVGELCDLYLEAAKAGLVTTRFKRPKRASTVEIDIGRVERHIKPLIGKDRADTLSRAAVQRMADAIAQGKTAGTFQGKARGKAVVTGGAGTAARVVELLGGIWAWTEKRGLVAGQNPAHGVETMRGEAKDRVLSSDELRALGKVLDELEPAQPAAVAAVRLIAMTGLRREEACALRWEEIDEVGSCLRLATTKTGRSTRPIGKPVLDLLQALPRRHVQWVFPNQDGSGSADLKKQIANLFDAAGLTDARSHDLRRTFATKAADEGYGDATIGELLGHARRGVTARHYIRRPDAALIAAADRVARRIRSYMIDAATEVVPIPSRDMRSAGNA